MLVTKPGKQRKMLFQAPLHRRYKHFSAPLTPELQKTHGVKSLPVRTGDTVMITRGDHKGFEGKITRVDRRKYRIFLEGLTREKVDGTTIFVAIHPSKVMITKLNLDDKWRKKILERRKTARKTLEEAKIVEEKPEEEKEEQKPAKETELEKPKKTRARKRAKRKKEGEETAVKSAKKSKARAKRKTIKRAKKPSKTKEKEGS